MDTPETRYVPVGDGQAAYQVFGEGPDLVLTLGLLVSHTDLIWEQPDLARLLSRLASFSRVAIFDRRGTGASDRLPAEGVVSWEDWVDDLNAVIGAAGMERPSLLATNDAGAMAMLFAATYPDRVASLILNSACARVVQAPDYPYGAPADYRPSFIEMINHGWGREGGVLMDLYAPDRADDPEFRRWAARLQRAVMTPNQAAAMYPLVLDIDARRALPLIQAETLVVACKDDPMVPMQHAEYLLEHIPDARLLVLDGVGPLSWLGEPDSYLAAVEQQVTGEHKPVEPDRVLATVLFTDIVGSTERLSELGDRRWRELLDRHDRVAGRTVSQFGGRLIKNTGDGILATFDGPARAVRAAESLGRELKESGVQIRSGLHAGEVELRGDDVGGIAVHIAARIMGLATPEEVLVSGTVKGLVAGSGLVFDDRGTHTLKGIPDEWALCALAAG